MYYNNTECLHPMTSDNGIVAESDQNTVSSRNTESDRDAESGDDNGQ